MQTHDLEHANGHFYFSQVISPRQESSLKISKVEEDFLKKRNHAQNVPFYAYS